MNTKVSSMNVSKSFRQLKNESNFVVPQKMIQGISTFSTSKTKQDFTIMKGRSSAQSIANSFKNAADTTRGDLLKDLIRLLI